MSNKPAVVLVHGFWGDAAHWSKVILDLRDSGYEELRAVELTLASLQEDAERVRQQIAGIGGPVLLVGHSYGGAVITEAGTADSVVGLVYVAAFAPDADQSVGDINSAAAPTSGGGNVTPDANGYLWLPQDKFHESFCQDLPEDEAFVMAVTQKAPPATTFGDKVSVPAWRSKPSWYQVSTEDRMIGTEAEREMAKRMQPRRTIELAAGHASLASCPTEIANLIDEAASALA